MSELNKSILEFLSSIRYSKRKRGYLNTFQFLGNFNPKKGVLLYDPEKTQISRGPLFTKLAYIALMDPDERKIK